jgi:hypothetical protein
LKDVEAPMITSQLPEHSGGISRIEEKSKPSRHVEYDFTLNPERMKRELEQEHQSSLDQDFHIVESDCFVYVLWVNIFGDSFGETTELKLDQDLMKLYRIRTTTINFMDKDIAQELKDTGLNKINIVQRSPHS